MKKNLLLITESFPFDEAELGFLETEFQELTECFQVTVLTSSKKQTPVCTVPQDVAFYRFEDIRLDPLQLLGQVRHAEVRSEMHRLLPKVWRHATLRQLLDAVAFSARADKIVKQMCKIVEERNIQLIYTYWCTEATLAALRMKNKLPRQLKVVTRFHGYDLYNERRQSGRQPLRAYIAQNADRLFFACERARKYFLRCWPGEWEQRCRVAYLGSQPMPIKTQIHGERLIIASCSNMIPLKRIECIIQSLALLPDNVQAEWHHFGDGTSRQILEKLADVVRDHVDMDRVLSIADDLPALPEEPDFWDETAWAGEGAVASSGQGQPVVCSEAPAPAAGAGTSPRADAPRIGYVRDRALWFYYEENLEALRRAGAELVRLSLLDDAAWPELDGLYLGGGFPEDWARELSASPHLARLGTLAAKGLPIYAECGGFMVLASALERDGQRWPMSGIFPVETRFCPKPQGLGYVRADVVLPNPYFPQGSVLRGHEFHYSLCHEPAAVSGRLDHALRLRKGTGMGRDAEGHGRDGLVSGRVWAAYCHIFAPAVPGWAPRFVELARCYRQERTGG